MKKRIKKTYKSKVKPKKRKIKSQRKKVNFLRITKPKFFTFIILALALHAIPNSLRCFEKLNSSYCISYYGFPFGIPTLISQTPGLLSKIDWTIMISKGILSFAGNLITIYIITAIIVLVYNKTKK